MKVFFHAGDNWSRTPPLTKTEKTVLSLSYNNWDDYSVRTTLNAVFYYDGERIFEFNLKLLIESDTDSPVKLNALRKAGWDGYFPIPDANYVSVPSDIEFYDALITKLGVQDAQNVLILIRDAGYLVNVTHDEAAKKLTEQENFTTSPLREAGARKSFQDGWKAFSGNSQSIKDFTLNLPSRGVDSVTSVRFRFNSDTLPYDINVLIGPNGVGKSHTLKNLVAYWLGMDAGSQTQLHKSKHQPFDTHPNISRLILMSYSPFEDFVLDLSDSKLKDKTAYRYFGFRRGRLSAQGKRQSSISRNQPASDSVESMFKALADDDAFGFLSTWTSKFSTIIDVLQPALGFEKLAVELNSKAELPLSLKSYVIEDNDGNQYIQLTPVTHLKLLKLKDDLFSIVNSKAGVVFLNDTDKLDLSSGQRLFVYMVINIVGQIKAESLIIVDEPELFLHPTFEVEFIALLKKVLAAFSSKAILATHSLAIAREVPANCMHVYRQGQHGLEVDHPPFETFGGNMQRISSYVFGDSKVTKPFAQWIEGAIQQAGSPKDLLDKLKDELNEEMTIKILNASVSDGR
ncbi:AAA family ATPase [Pseudomonas sp. BJa3]|uniref:AAA family ATPase n=1 Tax=Pseudomonas sp. BJa3 TaxID=2986525 RepID=UPI002265D703|nr:AAA family ATPase [Pseudomonas sp. BJa3]MCX5509967.1 ATP-binding protein [Pseudomonas sp. BJa3]